MHSYEPVNRSPKDRTDISKFMVIELNPVGRIHIRDLFENVYAKILCFKLLSIANPIDLIPWTSLTTAHLAENFFFIEEHQDGEETKSGSSP